MAKKIALVTGANRGIGLETAAQLAKKDFIVLIGARDKSAGVKVAEELERQGLEAFFLHIDPTNSTTITQAAKEVETKFGKLDVLINNAGTLLEGDMGAPSEVSIDVFRKTFDINVFGLHEVTKAFWPLLNKSDAARLVNVSSALGSLTMHSNKAFGDFRATAYDASKAAVNMMTVHYASQWSNTPHRANTIHPGSVKTDLNPTGELTVEEGAKTSVDLATIASTGPNGEFFHLGEKLPW